MKQKLSVEELVEFRSRVERAFGEITEEMWQDAEVFDKTPIPDALMCSKAVSNGEKILLSFLWAKRRAFLTLAGDNQYLADNCGMSERGIRKSLTRLRQMRLVDGYEPAPKHWTYFAQAGRGPIKIGETDDVEGRIRALQTANPEELSLLGRIPCELHSEKSLHERFKHLRLRGEWFTPAPELLEFIEQVAHVGG